MTKKDFGPFNSRREVFAFLYRQLRPRSVEQRKEDAARFRTGYLELLDLQTRRVVETAEGEAIRLGADLMDTGHLLAGVLEASPVDGLSIDDVRPRLARGFSAEDEAALASLGISLSDIVERAEANFGPDAMRSRANRTLVFRIQPSYEFMAAWAAAGGDSGSLRRMRPDQIFAALLDPSVNTTPTRSMAILHAIGFDAADALASLREQLGPPGDRAFFEGRGFGGAVHRLSRWAEARRGHTEEEVR